MDKPIIGCAQKKEFWDFDIRISISYSVVDDKNNNRNDWNVKGYNVLCNTENHRVDGLSPWSRILNN
jgi:hypothetical protein